MRCIPSRFRYPCWPKLRPRGLGGVFSCGEIILDSDVAAKPQRRSALRVDFIASPERVRLEGKRTGGLDSPVILLGRRTPKQRNLLLPLAAPRCAHGDHVRVTAGVIPEADGWDHHLLPILSREGRALKARPSARDLDSCGPATVRWDLGSNLLPRGANGSGWSGRCSRAARAAERRRTRRRLSGNETRQLVAAWWA